MPARGWKTMQTVKATLSPVLFVCVAALLGACAPSAPATGSLLPPAALSPIDDGEADPENPPAQDPPPGDEPSAEDDLSLGGLLPERPAEDPPAEDPPPEDPPADDPPADEPPADDPVADDPSAGTPEDPPPAGASCDFPHERLIAVDTASELATALASARPGDLIRLAPGAYAGRFKATRSGTAGSPIILCGAAAATLDGGSVRTGYVLHLDGADHWIVAGLTLRRGKKGVVLDDASDNRLTDLLIHEIGEEAVHFRKFSSRNVIAWSEIRDTGLVEPGYGEGVYVGSALNHWAEMSGSSDSPDRSDDNQVLNNVFGPGIAAEHIDIKEGTTGGRVRGNTFNGAGISGANYADSWMDVKGNGWRIEDNTGVGAPRDGFQLHVRRDGWGRDNVFANNAADVKGPGYGFYVDPDARGTVVRCDNVVDNAGSGFANVECDR